MSVFHEFYSRIQYVHRSNESIFAVSAVDDKIPHIDPSRNFECPPEENSSQCGPKRIGGSGTDESVELKDFDPK